MPALSWTIRDKLPRHGARDGDYRFDATEGERACRFFERRIRIPEGDHAHERYILPPWQEKYVRALYGWRHASGRRRYRRGLVGIARGNLKSTFGAGLSLKGLVADGQRVPKVTGAGTDRENASIIFSYASAMVRMEPALRRRLRILASTKRILQRKGQGGYHVISADATHAHGGHPTMIVFDDLQAQPSREFVGVQRTSQNTLDDYLFMEFMTAGFDRDSVGYEEWEHGLQVLEDPSLDEELLVDLYYAEAGDDLEDPAVMLKANPSLGISVREDFLRAAVKRALQRPSLRNEVMTLHFNIWVEAEFVSFIPPEAWDATAGMVDRAVLRGRPCYVGVWAASATDIACVVYVFPPEGARRRYEVVMEAFVPGSQIPRLEERDKITYRPWIDDGWLTLTEGDTIDEAAIRASIERHQSQGWEVQEVACNPRRATSLIRELDEAGFDVVPVMPSFAHMTPAIDELERAVGAKEIRHGGNRLLTRMVRSAQVRTNGDGDKKIDGERSRWHVGGVVALLMALNRTLGSQEDEAWAAS